MKTPEKACRQALNVWESTTQLTPSLDLDPSVYINMVPWYNKHGPRNLKAKVLKKVAEMYNLYIQNRKSKTMLFSPMREETQCLLHATFDGGQACPQQRGLKSSMYMVGRILGKSTKVVIDPRCKKCDNKVPSLWDTLLKCGAKGTIHTDMEREKTKQIRESSSYTHYNREHP